MADLDRAESIFHEAVDLSVGERADLLLERCGPDTELRALVEELLEHHDSGMPGFLEPAPVREELPWTEGPPVPRFIGNYEILRRIASGGMGSVFEALQQNPPRKVALKVMREDAMSRDALKRFHREIEVLGGLNHPGIAQIHEAGQFASESGVQPYFAMEFVPGRPLLEYAEQNDLTLPERLELVAKVCDALHFAHLKGVIHRDLKPENILTVDLPEGIQPKILDFGVAKAVHSESTITSTKTRTGQLLGTLPYMSPEQTEAHDHELDSRSDIYQIGIVLYRLLADRRPYDLTGLTIPQALHTIRTVQPPPLGDITPVCRSEIEAVVGRTLEKDRRRRHASAAELADDLRRCARRALTREPPLRRFGRWARRRARGVQSMSARSMIVTAAIVVLAAATTWKLLEPPALPVALDLAVLPFASETSDPPTRAFAAGLSEVVALRLARLSDGHELSVAHPSFVEVRRFPPPASIGTQLGANLAILGTLTRSGPEATLALSLAEEGSGRVLRRASATARFDDPNTLEWEILARLLAALEVELAPSERTHLVDSGTRSPSARHAYLQGLGHLQQSGVEGNVERASESFREALSLDPEFAAARVGLARAITAAPGATASERSRAVAECERALESDPDHVEAHLMAGTWLHRLGRVDEAREHLERANFLEPTNDEAVRGLIGAYESLGTTDRLESLLRAQIDLRPHYWQGYRWLGEHYYASSRFADAIPVLEKWTELAPRYYRAFNTLGAAHAEMGRWSDAARAFETSLELHPSGMAHANLGTVYFNQGFYPQAVEQFDKALIFMERSKRLNFTIFGGLADALYWAPGERAKSEAHYRKAIETGARDLERDPESVTTLGRLALYHAMLGEGTRALELLSKALELAPKDARTCFRAARVHQQLGAGDEALRWLETARELGTPIATIANHPAFRDLRERERFRALVASADAS